MRKPGGDKVKVKKGRKRRLTGWTLIPFGLLVAGVWLWSFFKPFSYVRTKESGDGWTSSGWSGMAVNGYAELAVFNMSVPPGVALPLQPGQDYIPILAVRRFGTPFWPIPLLLWLSAAPILLSGIIARRRAMKGSCNKCGYSLAGLVDGSP